MKILGHTKNIENIHKEIVNLDGGRSYLFSGPEAIGKFQAAFEIAKRILAEENFMPSEESRYPADLFVLEPYFEIKDGKKKRKVPSVDMIREAAQFLTRYPSKGKYRIVIFRDAHTLSSEAQNMLLKVLEEPQESALLFLITHEPGALLGTVRSRLMERTFSFLDEEELKGHYPDTLLNEHNIPPFFRSLGRPGILENALQESEAFMQKKEQLSSLYRLHSLTTKDRLNLAESLAQDVPEALQLLEWWVAGLRTQARKETHSKNILRIYSFLQEISEVMTTLKTTNANPRATLEQLFFQIRYYVFPEKEKKEQSGGDSL